VSVRWWLPLVLLICPALFALRFLTALPPDLRRYAWKRARSGRVGIPLAFDTVALTALIDSSLDLHAPPFEILAPLDVVHASRSRCGRPN